MYRGFFRSIRFKIILLYVLMLIITLSFFSLLIQIYFSNSLYKKMDTLLRVKAEGIEKSIQTFWDTENMGTTEDGFFSKIFSKQISKEKDQKFEKIADQLTIDTLRDEVELSDMVVNILDSEGNLVASSRVIPDVSSLTRQILKKTLKKQERFDDLSILSEEGKTLPVRVLTKLMSGDGRAKYVIQVVAPLKPLKTELDRIQKIIFLRIPVIVLISSLAAVFLVKVTLRPVDEMVNTIREIKPDNLDVRIHVPETNDEINRLAETFNQMLERLNISFSSQRQIIQDISHELKTPLTILKGQLQLALRKTRSLQEYVSILRSNLDEIEKIKRIVDEVLTLARLDSQKFLSEMKLLDLNRLIKSVLEDIKILAESKKIEVAFLARARITLNANEVHLRRLFTNLLENAVKYNRPGGKVTLQIDEDGQFVIIEISDNGIGIPEEDLPYIFDRFYRVDKARSSEGGVGLGLSIVKSIVEAHKGDIRVKSHWGEGTTFSIHFPLSA